jgi:hypothetical protein
MFIRVNRQKQGKKEYRHLQIAESYRDPEKGNSPRTRILAYLGTVEGLGEEQIEKLIAGLKRSIGQDASKDPLDEMFIGRDFGHVYAVSEIWKTLGLSEILSRLTSWELLPVAELIKLMVVNQVCDPPAAALWSGSTSAFQVREEALLSPPVAGHGPAHGDQGKARAFDRQDSSRCSDSQWTGLPITSTYYGDASLGGDIRGSAAADGQFDRRPGPGVVTRTRSRRHHVFPGNTPTDNGYGVVKDLKAVLSWVIFVADRRMLSDLNLRCCWAGTRVHRDPPLRRSAIAEVITQSKRFDRTAVKEQFADDAERAVRGCLLPQDRRRSQGRTTRRLRQADSFLRESLLAWLTWRPAQEADAPGDDKIRDYLRDKSSPSMGRSRETRCNHLHEGPEVGETIDRIFCWRHGHAKPCRGIVRPTRAREIERFRTFERQTVRVPGP